MIELTGINWEWTWGGAGAAAALLLAALYLHGRRTITAGNRQDLLFAVGWLLLLVIFLPPLFPLGEQLFTVHMMQRLLTVALIPFLLLRSDPWPVLQAGAPAVVRRAWRHLFPPRSPLRRLAGRLTGPQPVLLLFICNYFLWYDHQLHQWSINHAWLHQLELLLCLATALLYWWHILQVAPYRQKTFPPVMRVIYAAVGAIPIKAAALVLLFTDTIVYEYPGAIIFSGLQLNDQSSGAILVWSLGGVVYTWTAILLMRDWLAQEAAKPALPESEWATKEAMAMPGFPAESARPRQTPKPAAEQSRTGSRPPWR